MKRRDFTKGLVAAVAAPALPLRSFAAATTTGAAAVGSNFTPFMYSWSVVHARGIGQCSTDILMSKLGIGAETAQAIGARMIKKGIISAPNALGISQALAPNPPAQAVKAFDNGRGGASNGSVGSSDESRKTIKAVRDEMIEDVEDETLEIVGEEPSSQADAQSTLDEAEKIHSDA